MRSAVVGCGFLVFGVCCAQPATLPLSRAVEAPWAAQAYSLNSGVHTAIRPYLIRDLRALPGGDTLPGTAAMDFLERWGRNAFDSTTTGLRWRGGPLLDASAGVDAGSTSALTWRGGAGAWLEADAGKRWSFHLDGQAWNENWSDYLDTLVDAQQVSLGEGYAYGDDEARSHYDWNGWASFVPDEAFVLTVGRGKHFFGEGHRSFFLSDNAGSYPFLRINTEFWKIKYVNLFTVMDDIRGAGGAPASYDRKFSSFHYLSWNVTRRLNVAVFEGVVWQGADEKFPRGFEINYLNPVIFYRPVEYSQGSGDNALLGLALNVKPGKKSLFYSQVMLDEFLLDAVRAGDGWYGNKQAFQVGLVTYEAFKVKTLMLRAEFNYARPFIYTHSDTRQNYAHAGQPLAHPYGSNFREMLVRAEWRKKRWMVSAHLSYATLGQDTGAYSWGNNIFRPESERYSSDGVRPDNYGYFLADPVEVNVLFAEVVGAWTIDPRSGLRAEAAYVMRSRQPHGAANETTNWFRIGISTNLRQRYHDQEVRYVLE